MSALSVSEVDPCKEQLLNTLLMSETLVAKNEEHSVNNVEVSNVESITWMERLRACMFLEWVSELALPRLEI